MSIKKKAMYNLTGRFVEFLFSIATPIILIRIFTQDNYGLYQQVLIIGSLIASILSFNISQNLYYFYPKANNKEEQSIILSHTYFLLFLIALISLFITLFIIPFLAQFIFPSYNFNNIYLLAFFVFFTILNRSFDNLFVVEGKEKIAMFYYSINKILRGVFLITATLQFNSSFYTLLSLSIYLFIVFLFFYIYLRYNYKISPYKFDKKILRQQINYSLPFGFSGVLGTIGNYFDKIIITTFLPVRELAIYSVGTFRLPFIELVYTSVGNVILPEISRYSKDKDNGKIKAYNLWRKMIIKNIIITIPILFFSSFYSNMIITFIFGIDYYESSKVFRIIIWVFMFQMFGFGYILRGFGITKPILPANFVKVFLSILLGLIFTYYWGYVGTAFSFIIAYASNAIIQLYFTKNFLKKTWIEFLPFLDILKVILCSVISLYLSYLVSFNNTILFYTLIKVCLVYFSCCYILLYKMSYLPSIFKIKSFLS